MKKYIFYCLSLSAMLSCTGRFKMPEIGSVEINAIRAVSKDLPIESIYTGQTYGQYDIDISAKVEGTVQGIRYKEGSFVHKGDLLYNIDPLPYQNKVDQAEGVLAEANSYLVKAKSDVDRIEPLAKINAVSQRELTAAISVYKAAQAKVQTAEAALRNAKIELGYAGVTAPIDGVIGMSKVGIGDFITRGKGATLTTLSAIEEIKVRFTIGEQEFLRLYRLMKSDSSSLKGVNNIKLILSDGLPYNHTGKFNFVDRQVDPSTGAITLEAIFPNPEKLLRPGQYVKLAIITETKKNAIIIPQRTVAEIQGIYQIFTLDDSGKAAIKMIETESTYGDAYIVKSGISEGQTVLFAGTQLLKKGMSVTPKYIDWNGVSNDSISPEKQ